MGDLSAMAGVLILDVLCEVGDLLVELEVGGLQLGDAGHEALDPGLRLGQRLRGRGGATALVRQLRLQLRHLNNDGQGQDRNQCCGSGSESGAGSTGSTCFWASWIRIRILLSLSKYSKKNLDFYCFVTSF
jgi:hypothetical protein